MPTTPIRALGGQTKGSASSNRMTTTVQEQHRVQQSRRQRQSQESTAFLIGESTEQSQPPQQLDRPNNRRSHHLGEPPPLPICSTNECPEQTSALQDAPLEPEPQRNQEARPPVGSLFAQPTTNSNLDGDGLEPEPQVHEEQHRSPPAFLGGAPANLIDETLEPAPRRVEATLRPLPAFFDDALANLIGEELQRSTLQGRLSLNSSGLRTPRGGTPHPDGLEHLARQSAAWETVVACERAALSRRPRTRPQNPFLRGAAYENGYPRSSNDHGVETPFAPGAPKPAQRYFTHVGTTSRWASSGSGQRTSYREPFEDFSNMNPNETPQPLRHPFVTELGGLLYETGTLQNSQPVVNVPQYLGVGRAFTLTPAQRPRTPTLEPERYQPLPLNAQRDQPVYNENVRSGRWEVSRQASNRERRLLLGARPDTMRLVPRLPSDEMLRNLGQRSRSPGVRPSLFRVRSPRPDRNTGERFDLQRFTVATLANLLTVGPSPSYEQMYLTARTRTTLVQGYLADSAPEVVESLQLWMRR